MMMTLTTPQTIESSYPENVLAGGGAAIKWIHGLTREQLHSIVQDKNLPRPLLGELARNVPVKYLKNLVNHKKLEPEFRVSIFRRIFRANTNEMKNEEKLATYNSILNIKNISDKEKRIVNSYIQEIKKLLKKTNKTNSKKSTTEKKQKKIAPVIRKVEHIPPPPPPDSTLIDIVKFLVLKRSSVIWKSTEVQEKTREFNIKSALLAHEFGLNVFSFPTIFKNLIPPADLLSFRMEIDGGLYQQEPINRSAYLFEEFQKKLRGDFSKEFLDEFLDISDGNELLFSLMLKAISPTPADFTVNSTLFKAVSHKYDEILSKMSPVLNYGKVEVSDKGRAVITFSASVNLNFDDVSFKYWLVDEDESFGFPAPISKTFDYSSRLYACTVEITNLKPGYRYIYGISAYFDRDLFKLEPREFKVPDLPAKPKRTVSPYDGYSSSGYSFPIGGGGERRFQQF